jgi:hypothetical protein
LRIEGLYGQPEKMADGARLIRDFQPPLVAVSELRNGVADHVRAVAAWFPGLATRRKPGPEIDGSLATIRVLVERKKNNPRAN